MGGRVAPWRVRPRHRGAVGPWVGVSPRLPNVPRATCPCVCLPQNALPDVLAVVQVALEGAISKRSAQASLAAGQLPQVRGRGEGTVCSVSRSASQSARNSCSGLVCGVDLVPQTVGQQCPCPVTFIALPAPSDHFSCSLASLVHRATSSPGRWASSSRTASSRGSAARVWCASPSTRKCHARGGRGAGLALGAARGQRMNE